jgi:hypothetical protein
MIDHRSREIEALGVCLRTIEEIAHTGRQGAEDRRRAVRLSEVSASIASALRETLSMPTPPAYVKPAARNTMRARR